MSAAVGLNETGVMSLDPVDRRLVEATQAGLPLVPHPYRALAGQLGIDEHEIMKRLLRMQANGVIRRIGAVPNHYALGYRANGMSVWDVTDDRIAVLGPRVGALDFVSHCYHRPRHLPHWPYNLYAMVHGRTREAVSRQADEIAVLLGAAARDHEILFSTRILKKTGLRLTGRGRQSCSD
jgi:DNA-binding Lrp family transcriptional regulator